MNGAYRGRGLPIAVALLLCLGGVLAVGAFVSDVDDATPDPVPFDSVATLGLSQEDQRDAVDRELSIPQVQVFYSQYEYVVGYYGVEQAVTTLEQPEHDQQFGYPLVVYVSDYAGTGLELTDEGYLDAESSPGWVDASEAHFVVGSDAATLAGETVVPFGSDEDATAFQNAYGGEVVEWNELRDYEFDVDDAAVVRERLDDQRAQADDLVEARAPLLDRETEIVVGEDGYDTVQEALDAAPGGATVDVPSGTYEETVRIEDSVTLRGEDAVIRGDGEGNVVEVRADDVAITGISVDGVGNQTTDPDQAKAEAEAHDVDESEDTDDEDIQWDENIEQGYGHGDAGIHVVDASGVYVTDVSIETPANGVLLRDAPDAVVDGIDVDGSEEWRDGFMGVMSMRSPVVVQNSTVDGGRDGVYTHRSHETVIRDNEFSDNRFGVHLMHSSDTLIADNVARGQELAGLTIMTDPTHNAIVGNDVREAESGILPAGSQSYIADNVLANNGRGLTAGAHQSLYEHNTIYGNDVGMRTGSILASNRVVENDFVANDVHAEANVGPLRLWTHDGVGNYWDGAYGPSTGESLDRSYSPTDSLEGRLHTVDGTVTLAESPAMRSLNAVRGTAPGLRSGNVVDTAPKAEPVNPARLADLEAEYGATNDTNGERP